MHREKKEGLEMKQRHVRFDTELGNEREKYTERERERERERDLDILTCLQRFISREIQR